MRIAEAFQIFKVSQSGVREGMGVPRALTKDAGKLRKSKNGAAAHAGMYLQAAELLNVKVGNVLCVFLDE